MSKKLKKNMSEQQIADVTFKIVENRWRRIEKEIRDEILRDIHGE